MTHTSLIASRCEQLCGEVLAGRDVDVRAYANGSADVPVLRRAFDRAMRLREQRQAAGGKAWSPISSWQPGQVLEERYSVIRRLGVGGMGEVYLLRRLSDAKEYAGKRVRDAATGSPLDVISATAGTNGCQLQMLQEILRSMRVGSHPNVLRCKYFDVLEGGLVLFSAHLPSGSLAQALAAKTLYREPMPPHLRWLAVVLQVLDGLSHLHEHGIIHQDIKPSNVLVARCGRETRVRIADFGIARESQRDERGVLRPVGVAGLDPKFASPEQLEGRAVTDRTDVYSWAQLALDVLPAPRACEPPKPGAPLSQAEAIRLVPQAMDRTVAEEVARVLHACMQTDPAARPTAISLATALRQLPALPSAVSKSLAPAIAVRGRGDSRLQHTALCVEALAAAEAISQESLEEMDNAPHPLPALRAGVAMDLWKIGTRQLSAEGAGQSLRAGADLLLSQLRPADYEALPHEDRYNISRLRLAMLLADVSGEPDRRQFERDVVRLLGARGTNGMRQIVDRLAKALRAP